MRSVVSLQAALAGLLLSSLPFFKFLIYSFDALGPRGGPYFLASRK